MPVRAPAVCPAITVTKLADNLRGTAVLPTLGSPVTVTSRASPSIRPTVGRADTQAR
jgi:hypothetical protein